MKRSVALLLEEAKNKMNACVTLANYRYMNLCVEAEPAALLCVTVEFEGMKYDLEEVVNVSNPQKDQFALFPKDPSPALLFAICKAVKTSHPEFDIDVKDMDDYDDEEEIEEDEEQKYILLTMPKVNKERHDLINKGVDGLQKACQAKLDSIFQEYVAKITTKLAIGNPEELDEAKNELQNLHDEHKKMLNDYSDKKKAEVDEAYQRYQEEQEQKEVEKQEADAAQGKDKIFSMKMTDECEN